MKIAILSRNRNLYSTRRLIEAAEAKGHEVVVVDILRCHMNITSHKPMVYFKGKALDDIDVVIPRIGAPAGVAVDSVSVMISGSAVNRHQSLLTFLVPRLRTASSILLGS